MPRRRRSSIVPRKSPVQARSTQLVKDILEAAIRVLAREGPERLTTIRVAETAGVSVGSLYQYFPNKQAILFQLQLEEWERTSAVLDRMLGDRAVSPVIRLRKTTRAFFHSERDEAPLRMALDAAAPSWHHAPETRAQRERTRRVALAFVEDAAPQATKAQRAFAADFLLVTLGAVGKEVSERPGSRSDVDRWADATAGMLSAYLAGL